ncbi:probable proline--tRNA ligase, mitochondrial [Pseudomyrmex gracilis]|uniref:probable proline--tRNA ligase, mitochondrial n=1 Tax=Pseudomyrmex gracilis TaxID=219809 RepID=UPI000994F7D8|nr:probable proline--tRNA ligase, mitochondrial [Pseudomyrmex gracilis]
MASKTIGNLAKMSKLFQPMSIEILDKRNKEVSKNFKLLSNYGIIKSVNTGMYALLPLGMRALNKLIDLVDKEMAKIGAEKILLPALTSTALWKRSDRYDSNKTELFTVTDRHNKEYILSPTCEEQICDLISSMGHLPHKLLPLRLYQISSKWRDEMHPRLDLLRSREFVMKDLYTFDSSLEYAQQTYNLVCKSYDNIFKKLGIKYVKAVGNVGTIGGLSSHEYHYITEAGEDIVLRCPSCDFSINETIADTSNCPGCKTELHKHTTAEVGHTFLLNTKYSKPFQVKYLEYNEINTAAMGCFGLGLSRILMLAVETLSINNEMRWPVKLAPYTACVIPPKVGSKEEATSAYVQQLSEILCKRDIDAILDDRTRFTIGKRMLYARATGYPYIIVIGKAATQSTPLFELHDLNNSVSHEFTLEQLDNYFADIDLS